MVLQGLISLQQTAFIKGRQISKKFIATREMLHHIKASKEPTMFFKVDFAKAFDSIYWEFLCKVLEVRGSSQDGYPFYKHLQQEF